MKVFQVFKTWDAGDGHDNGIYESPLFTTREAAEAFRMQVWCPEDEESDFHWGCSNDDFCDGEPQIIEMEILEEVGEIFKAREYSTQTHY